MHSLLKVCYCVRSFFVIVQFFAGNDRYAEV